MITNAFSSRVTNWPLFWLLNALAVALMLMSGFSPAALPGLIGFAVVLLVANLTMTSVRITVGPTGVVVHYGLLGWPRFRYPISTISSAEAQNLSFAQAGGLGVHWSPWRGTRLVLRTGPALVLNRPAHTPVMISCDDPAVAARLINQAS